MRRREFITLLGGTAVAWPFVGRAQQDVRVRRIGVLWSLLTAEESQTTSGAFVQGLQQLGWSIGGNLRIDHRWGLSDPDRLRRSAEELVALAPDVLLAAGNSAATVLQQATRTMPIVFANVPDPVGAGFAESLPRPGGNMTGFMNMEYGQSAKWLELLTQIAPQVKRVAMLRSVIGVAGPAQFAAIQTVAPLFGVEVFPITVRGPAEIERVLTEFAHVPNGGLIMPTGIAASAQRSSIIPLAARHRLPAVYGSRNFVIEGGLICYGADGLDLYRRSASYVDRILKGEKPAGLPVQTPTKYQVVLNLKTAKAIGLDVPASIFARADEVIE